MWALRVKGYRWEVRGARVTSTFCNCVLGNLTTCRRFTLLFFTSLTLHSCSLFVSTMEIKELSELCDWAEWAAFNRFADVLKSEYIFMYCLLSVCVPVLCGVICSVDCIIFALDQTFCQY